MNNKIETPLMPVPADDNSLNAMLAASRTIELYKKSERELTEQLAEKDAHIQRLNTRLDILDRFVEMFLMDYENWFESDEKKLDYEYCKQYAEAAQYWMKLHPGHREVGPRRRIIERMEEVHSCTLISYKTSDEQVLNMLKEGIDLSGGLPY